MKNLQDEINRYIQEVIVQPLTRKRWNGSLTGNDIAAAMEGLLTHDWEGC